jgi:hypothetical protein
MNSRHDEGSTPERNGVVLTLKRGEGPEVRSFSEAEEARKPLVAFEVLPAATAAPSTWGSSSS